MSINFLDETLRLLHGGGGEADKDQTLNTVVRIIGIVVILLMAFGFGCIPFFSSSFRASVKLMGLSQAFSAGLFVAIALIHLLPEAAEGFTDYFADNNASDSVKKIPITYILVFFSFTLILFIEKVAFDSHSIIEHDHGDSEDVEKKSKKSKKSGSRQGDETDNEDEDEEEVIKNLVSSKGRVGSFIMENNLAKSK